MDLKTGDLVPDFTLPVTPEGTLTLSHWRGEKVVVYFYPKDDTPGCTLEGRDFTALGGDFAAAGTKVLGISRDDLATHRAFCDKFALGVPLASDPDLSVARAFGIMALREVDGQLLAYPRRMTFLIDVSGRLAQSWLVEDVTGHAAAVLAAARAL